jgi:mono/diheme cytochrome c family protein
MRSRAPLALILFLAVGLLTAGCFESTNSGFTVQQPITIGVGTAQTEVTVTGAATGATTSATATSTTGTTATSTTATTTTGSATGTSTTGQNFAAAKSTFQSTCGGCHTLKDAGTTGTVGPNLDQLKPTAAIVSHQIANAAPPMPKNLLQGAQAQAVANYVASVAGKS